MVVQPPFMYQAVGKESPLHAFSNYDPKAVSRASLIPSAPKPKPEGPYLNFNRHPDSWLVVPKEKEDVDEISPNIKSQIKRTRIAQLVLRCFELLAGIGLLASMILISKVQTQTGLLMRIPPGVAIFHALYGIYQFCRKYQGRSAASKAAYMLFAAAADVALIPFYGFSALTAESQYVLVSKGDDPDGEWSTLLPAGQDLVQALSGVVFLCAVIGGVFHLVSLGLSLWLSNAYRKIAGLPPDVDPLDDEATARARASKRSDVLISKSSTTSLTPSEARITAPLESKRNSGAPYEVLSRPPKIPFLETRSSSDSLPSYRSTTPEQSGLPAGSPPRQYLYNHNNTSQTNSIRPGKATPYPNTSNPHHSGSPTQPEGRGHPLAEKRDVWLGADSLTLASKRPVYSRVPQEEEKESRASEPSNNTSNYTYKPNRNSLPNPLSSHPSPLPSSPPPNFSRRELSPPPQSTPRTAQNSILSTINGAHKKDDDSSINDTHAPQPPRHTHSTRLAARAPSPSAYSDSVYSDDQASMVSSSRQEFGSPGKQYGGLGSGYDAAFQLPVMVGGDRSVSSGHDVGKKRSYRRDVSGKIVEEGRGGHDGGWGTRFRKVSGI